MYSLRVTARVSHVSVHDKCPLVSVCKSEKGVLLYSMCEVLGVCSLCGSAMNMGLVFV